ncbi:hypothetical protein ACC718_17975 [Rhizobium ruizarguesonis]
MSARTYELFLLSAVFVGISTTSVRADCGLDLLGICKAANQSTEKAVEGLKKEMEDTRKAALLAVDTAVRSVPGERYLRLIDDLNSGDPARAAAARAFLKSLANIEPDADYQLTVSYDFDQAKPFHVDFNRFQAPVSAVLEPFAKNSAVLDTVPAVTSLSPPTKEELMAHLANVAGEVLDAINGPPEATGLNNNRSDLCRKARPTVPDPYCLSVSFPKSMMSSLVVSNDKSGAESFNEMKAAIAAGPSAYNEQRNVAVKTLVNLMISAFSYSEIRQTIIGARKDWPLFDGKDFVAFFIDKETYESHTEDWAIRFYVHQIKNSEKRLYDRPVQTLRRVDFDPAINAPLPGVSGKTVYWAARDVTGNFAPNAAAVEQIESLRAALVKYGEQAK